MTTVTRQNAAGFQRPLNRPDPVGPVQAYKTYSIETPLDTHFKLVPCDQVGCLKFHQGFKTVVDIGTDLGLRQARYITNRSGRKFTATQDGTLITFVFPPGTECFARHRARVDRPPLLVVRNGDWRRYLGVRTRHRTPEDWVDDFATHQDKLDRYLRPERG